MSISLRCRIQHASYKRSIRKKELVVAPKELKGSMQCELCGRICLSLAGFKSHMRSHKETSAQVQYPEQVGLKCIKCGKIAKSKAGMKSHLKKSCKERRRRRSRRQSKISYSRTS